MAEHIAVRYDDEIIEYAAWQMAERDGYKYGRCALIDGYKAYVRAVIADLHEGFELQAAGEFD